MSDAPAPAAPSTALPGANDVVMSYWQLAARDFRRRWLAMSALGIVLMPSSGFWLALPAGLALLHRPKPQALSL